VLELRCYCRASQQLVLAKVNTLNDISTVEEHATYIFRVYGAREVWIAEVSTVRHRYLLHTHAHTQRQPEPHPSSHRPQNDWNRPTDHVRFLAVVMWTFGNRAIVYLDYTDDTAHSFTMP